MLKQLMLSKKIEKLRSELKECVGEEVKLTTRSKELEKIIDEVKSDEELETVDEEVEELEEKKAELEEKKKELEEEIAELEEELESLNDNEPKGDEGGKRNMNKDKIVREGINIYVRSKGEAREIRGFTSVEGGALIPEELLEPAKELEDVVDLSKLVNVVAVNSGGGKYPFIKKSGQKMNSVAELEKNPKLAKPEIEEITYSIETYRGYIPISQEVIDDADYDVTGLIADEITSQELNTRNHAIVAVLKAAKAKSVTGLDGLKNLFNVELKRVYNIKAIVSASLYNELDTTKDKNDRYLLQDDITVDSGKRLFGHEVVVLDDDIIGTKDGDLKGFIGDPKEFVALFDRKKASVKWVDNDIYGELLAGFTRFDVKEVDKEAGFYITYTPKAGEI